MYRFFTPIWRKVKKKPGYNIINTLGLTIGFSIGFLIFSYLKIETSYDRFYQGHEHIYRLGAEYEIGGNIDQFCNIGRPVGPALQRDLAGVAAQTRILGYNGLNQHKAFFKINERRIKSDHVFVADSTFFKVFDTDLLAGSQAEPLSTPASIVLTRSFARRLFGEQSPFNQTIELDGETKVRVTGVIEDFQGPTHLPYEALLSWDLGARPGEENVWIGWHTYTYLKLNEGYSPKSLISAFPAFASKYMAETMDDYGAKVELILQPIASIHLNSSLTWEAYTNNNWSNIYILLAIGSFLLLIAIINYINLATVQAAERSREVGIRKVLGSSKKALLVQFLAESILMAVVSAIFGLVLTAVLFSNFRALLSLDANLASVLSFSNLTIYLIVSCLTGVLAGIYPALFISRVRSTAILQGKHMTSNRGVLLRKILITVQFATSIGIIIASITVLRQLTFVSSSDLGFDKQNMMMIPIKGTPSKTSLEGLTARIEASPAVLAASTSASVPGNELNQTFFEVPDNLGEYNSIGGQLMEIENNFIQLMGMDIVKGRDFIYTSASEKHSSLLLNESASKNFGWQDDPIGKKLSWGEDSLGNRRLFEVVGVVRDFHVGSMHDQIPPIVIFLSQGTEKNLFVRLRQDQLKQGIDHTTSQWAEFDSKYPMEYTFLDQNYSAFYETEMKLYDLLKYVSAIILIISAMGLLGLVSFSVNIRKKEICIRRVLGSKIKDIHFLLTQEYLPIVGLSFLIGALGSWYFLSMWLRNFHYRINLEGWEFLVALGAVIFIVLSVLYIITMRATRENPTRVLRAD